jgi:agmatine deiminase
MSIREECSMAEKRVVVGLVQTSPTRDPDLNMKLAMEKVRLAAGRGAQIVCLPELYRTLYFPQRDHEDVRALAETIPGPSTDAFSALARELSIVVIVPIFEKDEAGYYNSLAVIDSDGSLLPVYRKVHIPHDLLFYEKSYFAPGDEIRIYDTFFGRIAALICFDQWFPEAARLAALGGAEIIFYPTAIGWINGEEESSEGDWRDAWVTVQRGHAISNSVYVAAVNRVGWEDDLLFWGGSFVCDCFGRVMARAGRSEEEVLVVELDLAKNGEVQEGWGFFRSRRPDIYWPLIEMVRSDDLAGGIGPALETPLFLGYHMPAEWEEHEAIWLSWPYDLRSFPEIEAVESAYVAMIKAIHKSETVNLLIKDEMMRDLVVERLRGENVDLQRVHFHIISYADVWFRDYGPTFVVNRDLEPGKGRLAAVSWIFNAWGEKYDDLMADAGIVGQINQDLKMRLFLPGIVLEGGSIDVNGCGTVLTTEQCLLNKNRNPGLSREEIESRLRKYLGVSKVIWLLEGIAGDDTDGHVDDIARFVSPTAVLCAYEDDPEDDNHLPLKRNYELLCSETDQDGQPLKVIKLPMPGHVGPESRLPASYCNFYIGNGVVLVPVFGDRNDRRALEIIKEAFPEREVVGIGCREMVYGLGTLHCISQQQPKG